MLAEPKENISQTDMLREEDDIKIKCLRKQERQGGGGEMKADSVKCNQKIKEEKRRSDTIRQRGILRVDGIGVEKESGERRRKEREREHERSKH